MIVSLVLACLVALGFTAAGVPKVLALAPMRNLATEAGFSGGACRAIGMLEVAGAAVGPVVPVVGVLAASGLFLLMVAAVITHRRKGDGLRDMTPALACVILVACYLGVLIAT
ncbi:DoxX family protein [Streptomyces sp. NPDC096057]|uniref:DoxX family protein n=1 Tax=Streptomyces sp. NPDC096057 TaxID=3155543 RepID=UPI0033307151